MGPSAIGGPAGSAVAAAATVNVAVEIDGEQHYVWPNRFHRTREEYNAQVARDRLKDKLSAENGVRLIRIPFTVKTKDIPYFLHDTLRMHGI
jgi:hypothetical protein